VVRYRPLAAGEQRDGTPGLLEGYNEISAFGQGALGTLGNRLSTVQNTLARQGANKSAFLQQREQQIKDAIGFPDDYVKQLVKDYKKGDKSTEGNNE